MVEPQSSKPGFIASSESWKTIAAVIGSVAALIGAVGGIWKLLSSNEAPKPLLTSTPVVSRSGSAEDVQKLLLKWVSVQAARNIDEFKAALTESAQIPFVLDKTLFKDVDAIVRDYAERFKKLSDKY